MRAVVLIFSFWLFIFLLISMSPKKYGSYTHWDVVKKKLTNHPTLKIIDFQTGITWDVIVSNENILGSFHADVEPKTTNDFETTINLWGSTSWEPRPVLVSMPDGELVAASIHNMPHAGLENEPYLKVVKDRTGGYGEGLNRDYVKKNGMSGHVCLHFYGSKSHKTKKEVFEHQDAVRIAANISLEK